MDTVLIPRSSLVTLLEVAVREAVVALHVKNITLSCLARSCFAEIGTIDQQFLSNAFRPPPPTLAVRPKSGKENEARST
jgi:hypothetical protein